MLGMRGASMNKTETYSPLVPATYNIVNDRSLVQMQEM